MATVVQINSIIFNNNTPDALGSLWYVDGLEGWDSPPQRLNAMPLPSQHGEVTVENLYGAREMTVTGLCKATSANNMFQSMYYLAAQTNALRNTVTFSVTEDTTRQCAVLRSSGPKTAYVGAGAFKFEMTFRADDPTKYAGTATTFTGTSTTLVNNGSDRVYPVITLGGAGAVSITIQGNLWQASTSIPSGTVIDMKNMTVLNGGTSYFSAVNPLSVWLYLQPGNNTFTSTVSATVSYRDAWI